MSAQIGQDIDDIWRGISDAGDGVYVGYVAYLEATILHQIFLIAGVVTSFLLVLILAYFIHEPFKSMMKILDEIMRGSDLSKRFTVSGRDELRRPRTEAQRHGRILPRATQTRSFGTHTNRYQLRSP